jgi:hypothetical protein
MITSSATVSLVNDRSLFKFFAMKLMDEKRVILIKHSWNNAIADKTVFASLLSKIAIELSKDLKPIVRQLQGEHQMMHILEMLNTIVIALPDFGAAEPEVLMFVSRYSKKGITNDNYEIGVIALLMTLEKKVKAWTPEFREAWIFLFASIHLRFADKIRARPRFDRLIQLKNNL